MKLPECKSRNIMPIKRLGWKEFYHPFVLYHLYQHCHHCRAPTLKPNKCGKLSRNSEHRGASWSIAERWGSSGWVDDHHRLESPSSTAQSSRGGARGTPHGTANDNHTIIRVNLLQVRWEVSTSKWEYPVISCPSFFRAIRLNGMLFEAICGMSGGIYIGCWILIGLCCSWSISVQPRNHLACSKGWMWPPWEVEFPDVTIRCRKACDNMWLT